MFRLDSGCAPDCRLPHHLRPFQARWNGIGQEVVGGVVGVNPLPSVLLPDDCLVVAGLVEVHSSAVSKALVEHRRDDVPLVCGGHGKVHGIYNPCVGHEVFVFVHGHDDVALPEHVAELVAILRRIGLPVCHWTSQCVAFHAPGVHYKRSAEVGIPVGKVGYLRVVLVAFGVRTLVVDFKIGFAQVERVGVYGSMVYGSECYEQFFAGLDGYVVPCAGNDIDG